MLQGPALGCDGSFERTRPAGGSQRLLACQAEGGENEEGWRIKYVKYIQALKENKEEHRIMKIPVITEEELIIRTSTLTNGKAAKIDGVKWEVIKRWMSQNFYGFD